MLKRVLNVGSCTPDHRAISAMIAARFSAEVSRAHDWDDAVEHLRAMPFDLVLVNRMLDSDRSDGVRFIERLKQDPDLGAVPVMLVTNFPEHQRRAMQAGAVEGFGKQSLTAPETLAKLAPYLSPGPATASQDPV
ncbi:MAG: response regulator [Pirellulaceae bacterium]|jgi:CheY-like chemotaxis protein|nr:response regulator [Pirellulaceae bacterium]